MLEIAGPRGLRHITCALTDAWQEAGYLTKQRDDLERRYAGGRSPEAWTVRPSVLPLELYPDIWLANQAQQRMATLPEDQPWLLWISFVGPHEPFDTPEPWAGRHRTASLPAPTDEPPWISSLPAQSSPRQSREHWKELTPAAIDACRRDYADGLQLLDDQVGKIIKTLSTRPDASRTAVALTADHGELLGDGGMLYKGTFLEGAIRVPWIYRPAPDENHTTQAHTENPLSITPLLHQCFENLGAGGTLNDLTAWAQKPADVCCEFADELMVLAQKKKLIMNHRRRALWAIDLEQDPQEHTNVIRDDRKAWRRDPEWKALRQRARNYVRERRQRDWKWAQLEDIQ